MKRPCPSFILVALASVSCAGSVDLSLGDAPLGLAASAMWYSLDSLHMNIVESNVFDVCTTFSTIVAQRGNALLDDDWAYEFEEIDESLLPESYWTAQIWLYHSPSDAMYAQNFDLSGAVAGGEINSAYLWFTFGERTNWELSSDTRGYSSAEYGTLGVSSFEVDGTLGASGDFELDDSDEEGSITLSATPCPAMSEAILSAASTGVNVQF